jgi:hypothetical protein
VAHSQKFIAESVSRFQALKVLLVMSVYWPLISFWQERVVWAPPKKGRPFFVANARRSSATRRRQITQLLHKMEKKIDVEEMKFTLADFIRLTQLERELEDEEQPREIIVTWKDAAGGHSDSK